jgi:hypothetical protein
VRIQIIGQEFGGKASEKVGEKKKPQEIDNNFFEKVRKIGGISYQYSGEPSVSSLHPGPPS